MPTALDLPDVPRGAPLRLAFVALSEAPSPADADGEPVDLTGWRFRLDVSRPGRTTPALSHAWAAPGRPELAADAAGGLTWAEPDGAATAGLRGPYVYELWAGSPETELALAQAGRVRFV